MLQTIIQENNIGKRNELIREYIKSAKPTIAEMEAFLEEQIQSGESAVWVGICKEIQEAVKRHVCIGYQNFQHFKFMDEELDEIAETQLDEFADQKKVRTGQEEVTNEASFLNLTQKEKLNWLESCQKTADRRKLLLAMGLELLKKEKQPFVIVQLMNVLGAYYKKSGREHKDLLILLHKLTAHSDEDVHIKALENLALFLTGVPKQDKPLIDLCLKGLSDRSRRIQVSCAQLLRQHYPQETTKFIKRLIANATSDKDCLKIRFAVREFEELSTIFDQKMSEFVEVRSPKKEDEEEKPEARFTPQNEEPLFKRLYQQIAPHFLKLSILINVFLFLVIIALIALNRTPDTGLSIELAEQYTTDLDKYRSEIAQLDNKLQRINQEHALFTDGLRLYLKAIEQGRTQDYEVALQKLEQYHQQAKDKELTNMAKELAEKIRTKDAGLTFLSLEKKYTELQNKQDIISLSQLLPELEHFQKNNPQHPQQNQAKTYIAQIKALLPTAEKIKTLQNELEELLKTENFASAEKILQELRQTRPNEAFFAEEEKIARRRLGNLLGEIHQCLQKSRHLRDAYGEDNNPYYLISWYYLYQELAWPESAKEYLQHFLEFSKPTNIFLDADSFIQLIKNLYQIKAQKTIDTLLSMGEKIAADNISQRNANIKIMSAIARAYAHTGKVEQALAIIESVNRTVGFRDFATEQTRVAAFIDIIEQQGKSANANMIRNFLQDINQEEHPQAYAKLKVMLNEYEGLSDFIQQFPDLDSTGIATMIASKGEFKAAIQLLEELGKNLDTKRKQAENTAISTTDNELFQQIERQRQGQLDEVNLMSGKIIQAWLNIGLLMTEKGIDTTVIKEKLQPLTSGKTPEEIVPAAALSAEIALAKSRKGAVREAKNQIKAIIDEANRNYQNSGQEIFRVFSILIAARTLMQIGEKSEGGQALAMVLQLIDRREWDTEFLLYNLKRPALMYLSQEYYQAKMYSEADKAVNLLANYIKNFESGNYFLKTAQDYKEAALVFALLGKTDQAFKLLKKAEELEPETMKTVFAYQKLATEINRGQQKK